MAVVFLPDVAVAFSNLFLFGLVAGGHVARAIPEPEVKADGPDGADRAEDDEGPAPAEGDRQPANDERCDSTAEACGHPDRALHQPAFSKGKPGTDNASNV